MGVSSQAPGKLLSPALMNLTLMGKVLICLRSHQMCHHHHSTGAFSDLLDMLSLCPKEQNLEPLCRVSQGFGFLLGHFLPRSRPAVSLSVPSCLSCLFLIARLLKLPLCSVFLSHFSLVSVTLSLAPFPSSVAANSDSV